MQKDAKSVSVAQQEAMGIARAIQEGKQKPKAGTPSAEIAKTMKPSDTHDFAATEHKGLPQHHHKKSHVDLLFCSQFVR